jgi:hypothetical protein
MDAAYDMDQDLDQDQVVVMGLPMASVMYMAMEIAKPQVMDMAMVTDLETARAMDSVRVTVSRISWKI